MADIGDTTLGKEETLSLNATLSRFTLTYTLGRV